MKARLLIVDDDAAIRAALSERFQARGYAVTSAASGVEALERARRGVELVLLDLMLPQGDGLWVLERFREEGIAATVVVITAHGSVEKAVEAMRAGAYDFLQKPFEPALIEETLRRALERTRLLAVNRALRGADVGDGPLAVDPRMERVLATARRAAASDATVLLLGESGTGKEVLARALHRWSPRADGPFVAVNCAALAEGLLESELFGHEKGAFTGAHERRVGCIEAAHGGTLFLDELGDTSPALQAKLLRVLEQRTLERVGGTRTIEVDLRVVAATNRDLKERVAAGAFREDLYYRLNVIALTVPPLRERPADVEALARHFVQELAREVKRPGLALSDDALLRLRAHSWPGNVRELKNALERAVVLAEGERIEADDLPEELGTSTEPSTGFHGRVESFRRALLRDTLAESGGNQAEAARRLGLQRTYLARLVRRYGL
ncbi:MAG: sigma-54-dependent Fis family transcriptional regulator [Planctomycetes bacterium]|nr:sigma-54-dependent Fis family transcriptional regulator [Planctomycetota bacterium]